MKKTIFLIALVIAIISSAFTVLAEQVPGPNFPDVEEGSYYEDAVYKMLERGVILGYQNGNFGPNDAVTRGQVATILDRYDQSLAGTIVSPDIEEGSCGNQWAKVFEGSYSTATATTGDRWYALSVTSAVTHPQLQAFVRDGCDFKLVVDESSGGGSGPKSYECSVVSAFAGPSDVIPLTNTFSCNTAVYSPDGSGTDGYSEGKRLVFQGGTVYFQPLGNQPDPSGPLTLSLFIKK